jgi:hypothetical protein
MSARFSTVCPMCSNRIAVGESIQYMSGRPAVHTVCPMIVALPSVNTVCEHPQFHRSGCVCAKQFPVGMGDDDHSYEAWLEFKAEQPQYISVDEIGVYVMPDGSIVKVQPNKEKTRTYAKRWVAKSTIDRLTDGHEVVHGDYVFEGGLVSEVAAHGRKMTMDEARAFIIRYGVCVRCSRKLKNAKSVDACMGPKCRTYFTLGA